MHEPFIWTEISQTIKFNRIDIKPFFTKQKKTVFYRRPLSAKMHMAVPAFNGDQKYGINENKLEKGVWALDFILAQVGQFTTGRRTNRHRSGPSAGGRTHDNIHRKPPTTITIFKSASEDVVWVACH